MEEVARRVGRPSAASSDTPWEKSPIHALGASHWRGGRKMRVKTERAMSPPAGRDGS